MYRIVLERMQGIDRQTHYNQPKRLVVADNGSVMFGPWHGLLPGSYSIESGHETLSVFRWCFHSGGCPIIDSYDTMRKPHMEIYDMYIERAVFSVFGIPIFWRKNKLLTTIAYDQVSQSWDIEAKEKFMYNLKCI